MISRIEGGSTSHQTADVYVYGAGPAGLMACQVLAEAGLKVILRDHKQAPGRKFLLAGRGGLNLTHSEPLSNLLDRYGQAREQLRSAIEAFPPEAVRTWCHQLGEETFIGTSGRIFPKSMKASPLLRKWLQRLAGLGVQFQGRTPWAGFGSEPAILAFGGASWPELGSDGTWSETFQAADIKVQPFVASNGRQRVAWSEAFKSKHAGSFLKSVALRHQDKIVFGDLTVSSDGIEGTPVYALSASLRGAPHIPLILDLKPGLTDDQVAERLAKQRPKDSYSTRYRKAFGLSPVGISLLRELKSNDPKHLEIFPEGPSDLRRAISAAGGVGWSEVDDRLRLKRFPHVAIAGEMLDWDAPTGGYLLQACFATGYLAAQSFVTERSATVSLSE